MKEFKNLKIVQTEAKINKEEAYWISPRGKISNVPKYHIDLVIKTPKVFGYDSEEIQGIYDKFGEELGSEGNAREEIIQSLFKQGWIRIRKYMRPYRWTLNVNNLNTRTKDNIKFFADMMLKKGHSPYDEVVVDTPTSRERFNFTQLSEDVLYLKENEVIPENRNELVEVSLL